MPQEHRRGFRISDPSNNTGDSEFRIPQEQRRGFRISDPPNNTGDSEFKILQEHRREFRISDPLKNTGDSEFLIPQEHRREFTISDPPVNLMNTALKRSTKFRIAQNRPRKITQTLQLTLASLQTPFSLSALVYMHTLYLHNVELICI